MIKIIFTILLLCSCQTTHNIKVQQQDIHIQKMEHLQKQQYSFEIPQLEKQGDKYTIEASEVNKIIRNNKRFTTIIDNLIDEGNTKLLYYEDTIKNLGGVFE